MPDVCGGGITVYRYYFATCAHKLPTSLFEKTLKKSVKKILAHKFHFFDFYPAQISSV